MTKGEQIVAMTVGKTNRDGYPKLTENHPFFGKLKAFMDGKHYWMGTATDLLTEINDITTPPNTVELVRELRKNKRKPTRTGIVSMFSGLVYCADCGEKLYYSATNNYKENQAYFFCSSYRKNSDVCSAHYIREK